MSADIDNFSRGIGASGRMTGISAANNVTKVLVNVTGAETVAL